jgi:DnaJ-domain-containing protein 1
MTDYFALLEQPRTPWLDLAALKEVFHRKTLEHHPDSTRAAEGDFAKLNEAYQVLQDPKRRLHHLLELQGGPAASTNQVVPQELQELFLEIGEVNQRMIQLLEKIRASSNPLSRSLLHGEVVAAQKEVATLQSKVCELTNAANERLRQMNPGWLTNPAAQIADTSALYLRFSYLGRWSAQLDELAFQLSS